MQTGWWVPGRALVRMQGLMEVVILRPTEYEALLPVEWQERTKSQWKEELEKVVEKWPPEWKGRMPFLRFAQSLEEAASEAAISRGMLSHSI
jgi:hypothetical protein